MAGVGRIQQTQGGDDRLVDRRHATLELLQLVDTEADAARCCDLFDGEPRTPSGRREQAAEANREGGRGDREAHIGIDLINWSHEAISFAEERSRRASVAEPRR